MKKIAKILITLILVASLCVAASMPAFAARPGTEFLSELHLAEAKDAATAKEMLTSNGYKVFNKNLNPEGDKAVYLGYKTSTDVEDAITDISVMNMKGGFSTSNYEKVLEESFDEYKEMISNFRTAANEFASNYKAKHKEAVLAYRQLNYYFVEKNGQKTKMGDYMLSFPENDEDFADILMKGNVYILSNIRTLLAMGSGEKDITLSEKIAKTSQDENVYKKAEYYDNAKLIYETLKSTDKDIAEAKQKIEDITADDTITDEEKEELIGNLKTSVSKIVAFKTIFESLTFKDTTYGEYLKENPQITDYSVFYPILEAMTAGQRALVPFGQLIPIFVYDTVEKSDSELEAELEKIEADFNEISVFFGTDMGVYEGSFAVTDEALRNEAATGKSWTGTMSKMDLAENIVKNVFMGIGGAGFMAVCINFINGSKMPAEYASLVEQAADLSAQINAMEKSANAFKNLVDTTSTGSMNQLGHKMMDVHEFTIKNVRAEYDQVTQTINGMQSSAPSTLAVVGAGVGVAIGAAILGYSIYSMVKIISSYNVKYTDIPTNMVDCVDTEYGDRYIRYSVVNSYYKDGDKVKSRAGDTNAYDGEEWNAIYYTKNYEAGKCMLATADWPVSEDDFGKYAPVRPFGQKICYNLNAHSSETDTAKVFLALRTSNAQKAAASEVPTVVGSAFNYGLFAISGVLGIGLGMGIMGVIKRKRKDLDEVV